MDDVARRIHDIEYQSVVCSDKTLECEIEYRLVGDGAIACVLLMTGNVWRLQRGVARYYRRSRQVDWFRDDSAAF
jgi:hypothetical protein